MRRYNYVLTNRSVLFSRCITSTVGFVHTIKYDVNITVIIDSVIAPTDVTYVQSIAAVQLGVVHLGNE